MKQLGRIYTAFVLSTLVLLGACQKEANAPVQEEEKYTQFVEIDGELEDINTDAVIDLKSGKVVSDEQLRMAIVNRQVNGRNAGVDLVYGRDESIQVHLFFRQGSQTALVSTTAVVKTNDKGKKTLSKTIASIPSQINLARGGVKVTGVVGVKNPRIENGQFLADVPSIKDFLADDKNTSYVLPMFFPETEVQAFRSSNGSMKYGSFGRFQLYGSIVGIPMNNLTDTKFTLYSTALVTSVFDTQGTMDLTNTVGSTQPTWRTTQTATGTKVVDIPEKKANTPQGFNAGEKNWYFFWVKPKQTNITSNTKLTVSLRSFSGTEHKFEVPVKKLLAEQRVHRIPEVKLPLMPDLIFSEVMRGDYSWRVSYELYNCSDHDVNLWNYQIQNSNGLVSPLLQKNGGTGVFSSDACVFVRDLSRGVNCDSRAHDQAFVADDLPNYLETKIILKPGQMATFVHQEIRIKTQIVTDKRDRLRYTINYGKESYAGFYLPESGYVELQRRRRNSAGTYLEKASTVDVFLKLENKATPNVWFYTMMRKPDRNTPRQYMKIGKDTDWVARYRTEDLDWGYRFGYERNPNWVWFDAGKHSGIHNWSDGYVSKNTRQLREVQQVPSGSLYWTNTLNSAGPEYTSYPSNWKRPFAH